MPHFPPFCRAQNVDSSLKVLPRAWSDAHKTFSPTLKSERRWKEREEARDRSVGTASGAQCTRMFSLFFRRHRLLSGLGTDPSRRSFCPNRPAREKKKKEARIGHIKGNSGWSCVTCPKAVVANRRLPSRGLLTILSRSSQPSSKTTELTASSSE